LRLRKYRAINTSIDAVGPQPNAAARALVSFRALANTGMGFRARFGFIGVIFLRFVLSTLNCRPFAILISSL